MNPKALTPFDSGSFSVKSFWLLCVVCLLFFAGNVRADGDLSPADTVQAERLQKQIDADNKAAHDKAEKEWQQGHSSGGNVAGLIVPAILISVVVGFALYAKNKTAGKAFAGMSVIVIGGMVVVSVVDSYQWTHPEKPSADTAQTAKMEAASSGANTNLEAKIKNYIEANAAVTQDRTTGNYSFKIAQSPTAQNHNLARVSSVKLVQLNDTDYNGTAMIQFGQTPVELKFSAKMEDNNFKMNFAQSEIVAVQQ